MCRGKRDGSLRRDASSVGIGGVLSGVCASLLVMRIKRAYGRLIALPGARGFTWNYVVCL